MIALTDDEYKLFDEVQNKIAQNVRAMMEELWLNWSHLGVEKATKAEKMNKLVQIETEFHHDVISETRLKLKTMQDQVDKLKEETEKLSSYLSVDISIMDFKEDMMLADYKRELEDQISGYREQLEKRSMKLKRLLEWQRDLAENLGINIQEMQEIPLPSEEVLDRLKDHLEVLQAERDKRTEIFLKTQVEIKDNKEMAFRVCGEAGQWLGRHNEITTIGWTNFTPCFPPEVKNLLHKVYGSNAQHKFEIAVRTRTLEMIGFTISLIALIVSLIIMCYYRSLRNSRTKIHMNLFCAMILQVVLRLFIYTDQAALLLSYDESFDEEEGPVFGFNGLPFLCEVIYILLEYSISVMFMWMFMEGLYLNNLVSTNTLKEQIPYRVFFVVGWILPLLITIIWAVVTSIHYRDQSLRQCWYGYNFLTTYWILQAPRLTVVMMNFLFLLNILRVLVLKMQRSENTELDKVRKAVRAAFVLLPLLGITNALEMWEAPLDGSVWQFALWSYTTYFFRSFQGFFIALIYCFLNAEVRTVIRKHYVNWKAMRETRRRNAEIFRANGRSFRRKTPSRRVQIASDITQMMTWSRAHDEPLNLPDIETSFTSNIPNRRPIGTDMPPGLEQSRSDCFGECVATIEHHQYSIPSANRMSVGTDPALNLEQSRSDCFGQCVATIDYQYNVPSVITFDSTQMIVPFPEMGEPPEPRNLPEMEIHNIPNRRSIGTDLASDLELSSNDRYGQCIATIEREYSRPPASREHQSSHSLVASLSCFDIVESGT